MSTAKETATTLLAKVLFLLVLGGEAGPPSSVVTPVEVVREIESERLPVFGHPLSLSVPHTMTGAYSVMAVCLVLLEEKGAVILVGHENTVVQTVGRVETIQSRLQPSVPHVWEHVYFVVEWSTTEKDTREPIAATPVGTAPI